MIINILQTSLMVLTITLLIITSVTQKEVSERFVIAVVLLFALSAVVTFVSALFLIWAN